MLKIENCDVLTKAMNLAITTKTEADLMSKLLYLDNWYGRDKVSIYLRPDLPSSPSMICWHAYHINNEVEDKTPFYNGGLVYHEYSNEWGIHS